MIFHTARVKVLLRCFTCKKKQVYRVNSEDLETKGFVNCFFCGRPIMIVEKKGMILGKQDRHREGGKQEP